MAYTDQTNRVGSLILRFLALGLNIASIIMLAIGFPTGMLIHIILFIIVALWGLVDFVLLLCKRFHHPGIDVALDLIAVLILVIMGVFGTAVFHDLGFKYNDIKALRIGIIVAFFSALFYFISFVRACVHTHQERREGKRANWEMSKMNRV